MQRRTRRVLLWSAGVAAVLVLGAAAVLVTFAVQFSGGWDEVLDRSHPAADDPEVQQARAQAAARTQAELDRIVDDVVAPALPGAVIVAASSEGPGTADSPWGVGCEAGQHNFKRDDPYDLLCTEASHAVLATPFAALDRLDDVDAALVADGWAREDVESLLRAHASWVGGSAPMPPDAPTGATPLPIRAEDLPPAYYRSADGATLQVAFGDPAQDAEVPAPDLEEGQVPILMLLRATSFLE